MLTYHSDVLSDEGCARLREHAGPLLCRRFRTNNAPLRRGAKLMVDTPETLRLRLFASYVAGVPMTHVEPVEVVRYSEGYSYPRHYDGFWRPYSLLVYLNDDYDGGRTHFPELNTTVAPETGLGVSWQNSDAGKLVLTNAHEVQRLDRGLKWVAVVWTLDAPYEPGELSGTPPKKRPQQ